MGRPVTRVRRAAFHHRIRHRRRMAPFLLKCIRLHKGSPQSAKWVQAAICLDICLTSLGAPA
jgi:hypothetical protein